MKRPDRDREPPGGRRERRRRQFEDSRGLSGRPALPLDEDATADEPDTPESPTKDKEPAEEDNEKGAEGGAR